VRGVTAKAVQCDEIWSFSCAKQKNDKFAKGSAGSRWGRWTWTDADAKLIVSWHVGDRSQHTGIAFMSDLKARLANRVQLITDGHKASFKAVAEVDLDAYTMLNKIFATDYAGPGRYSPPKCIWAIKNPINGNPDPALINTSLSSARTSPCVCQMRRFTRLINAFSKKFENHCHALALHFVF
jgi:IS1 family transposase